MAEIRWLPEALDDIERLCNWLIDKDADAATRAISCVLKGINLLKESPRLGRPMLDPAERRELFVALGAGAYVLRYKLVDHDNIVII